MSMIKRRSRSVPELNMASMPDLIFTVLFFFMIVSHMRSSQPMVSYQLPEGAVLTKPEKKSAVVYLYVGEAKLQPTGRKPQIQINNMMVTTAGIPAAIQRERKRMSLDDRRQMVVCIKADRNTPMSQIAEVKRALRKANATRIIYSANKQEKMGGIKTSVD